MKILRSTKWSGYSIGDPEWTYIEMNKTVLFKNQVIAVTHNGNCNLVEGDSELVENWLGGDDSLSNYYTSDLGQPTEPGVYLVDVQTWVTSGSYEYPDDTDVEFSIENIRQLDLDVPQIPFESFSDTLHLEPPLFKLEGKSPEDNYVTDQNTPPFRIVGKGMSRYVK